MNLNKFVFYLFIVLYYMSILSSTDTSPSTRVIPYEKYNVTLTFQILELGVTELGTFDVPATFIRTGKIVNMSISPFYVGPTIPNGAYGTQLSMPVGTLVIIKATEVTGTPVPRRCFNLFNTSLPRLTGDVFIFSSASDGSGMKRGVFNIRSENTYQGGTITLADVYQNNAYYYPTTEYFSCPYGIDATWITDNEFD